MKRLFVFFVLFFIISSLFSQITVDSTQLRNLQKNKFNTSFNNTTFNTSEANKTRDLVGYNIYIDGVFVGWFDEFWIGMFYYWFVPGQSYIIGIEAVYTNGAGPLIEFIYIYNPDLNSVEDFHVTNSGYISWDPPDINENSRDLLGYNVYLNIDLVTFTTDLFYQYDENSLIEEQLYVSGVTAVYDEGESSTEFGFFNYLLYNPMINVNPDEINVTLDPDELTYEDLTVSNPGDDILFYEIEIDYLSGDSWILLNTSYMYNLEAGESNDISVPISSAGVTNTTLNAELIFENNVGAPIIVPVTMIVNDSLAVTSEFLSGITQVSNHPNPFNPSTTIEFAIQNDSNVEISFFNVKGQIIKTLSNNLFTKGNHSIIWNGDNEFGHPVSSGIYYYKLSINGETEAVKKCLLLK